MMNDDDDNDDDKDEDEAQSLRIISEKNNLLVYRLYSTLNCFLLQTSKPKPQQFSWTLKLFLNRGVFRGGPNRRAPHLNSAKLLPPDVRF